MPDRMMTQDEIMAGDRARFDALMLQARLDAAYGHIKTKMDLLESLGVENPGDFCNDDW